ncbi:MAG: hypothetical protein LYZ70_05865, partial [Nitrososphaerales archaeon]|nr:hypothetical protein [Nitrososphaerales archaeon]
MTESMDAELAVRTSMIIRSLSADMIFLMGPGTRNSVPGLLLAKRNHLPLILDIEDYTILYTNPFLSMFSGLTVSTTFLKNLFARYKPFYLPNSSDLLENVGAFSEVEKSAPVEIIWHGVLYDYLLPSFSKL